MQFGFIGSAGRKSCDTRPKWDRVPPFDIFRLNRMGSLYVTSAGLANYISIRSELLERADELFSVFKSGAVRVNIRYRYRLAVAAQAHRDLESGRTVGSSMILP